MILPAPAEKPFDISRHSLSGRLENTCESVKDGKIIPRQI